MKRFKAEDSNNFGCETSAKYNHNEAGANMSSIAKLKFN